ncbi:MAG: ubiquinone biosynthesis protein [Verrucomicrobiales bacterium]
MGIMLSIRKIGVFARTYRHLERYRHILGVLIKYGFDDIVGMLKIEHYLEIGLKFVSRKSPEEIERFSRPVRLRMALEELGPTFIKLGQLLSTRPDLVPLGIASELAKLQDKVPPFPVEEVHKIIRAETGHDTNELFATFDDEPLAAASIAQVHKAVLRESAIDGSEVMEGDVVAVKVQRPDLRKIIDVDLEILLHLAGLAERHVEELQKHHPTKIVEEFARSLEREISFENEAANIERFSACFLGDDAIYVPKVYRQWTTERILVLEFVQGIKPSESEQLRAEGYDVSEIAAKGAGLLMKQVFVHGFFHADLHPGNMFILPRNVICYIDFGQMGRISQQERVDFIDVLMRVVKRDESRITRAILKLTTYDTEPNHDNLERDLLELLDQHLYLPLGEVDLGRLLEQVLDIVTRHQLSLKPNLFLMIKAIMTVEGVGRSLDKNFKIIQVAEPFVKNTVADRMDPRRIASDLFYSGADVASLLTEIPGEVRSVLRQAREGKIKIQFEHHGLSTFRQTNDQISNRISFAIVLAALIVGSSLIVLSGVPPKWGEIPIIGLVGFVMSGLMGFWLLLSILKHGRM